MTTLYIDRRNLALRIHGDALIIDENGQRINTIPLKILQRVCIHGDTTLTAQVLGKLGEENIGVLILNGRQQRPTLLMPSPKLDGKRRQSQYAQSQNPQFAQQIAEQWVSQKIAKQIQLLQQFAPQSPISSRLANIAAQIHFSGSLNTLRGLEGATSAQYFGEWQNILLPEWQFTGRNRRPPRDPVNALLSLGYTLLHFEIVKHIYLAGLDPFIGFYHTATHGRESLACDLLEPLRPEYDQWVFQQILEKQNFSPKDFSTTAQGCTLNKETRLRFYQEYEQLAKSWRSKIHENCRQLLRQLAPNDPDFDSGSLNIIAKPENESQTE